MSTIEIIPGGTDRPHRELGEVTARKRAMTVFHKAPEISAGEEALRKKAAELGADAVIHAEFDRGISAWSWKTLNAKGTAIAFEDAGAGDAGPAESPAAG